MRFLLGLLVISTISSALCQPAEGQEFRKTVRDFCIEKPLQYSPDDPWTRSRVFRLYTGHAGLFYNCDCEEEKRNSPYICWKTTCENQILPKRSFLRIWTKDIENTRQRIIDGAGACCGEGCGCHRCRQSTGATCGGSECKTCDAGHGSEGQSTNGGLARNVGKSDSVTKIDRSQNISLFQLKSSLRPPEVPRIADSSLNNHNQRKIDRIRELLDAHRQTNPEKQSAAQVVTATKDVSKTMVAETPEDNANPGLVTPNKAQIQLPVIPVSRKYGLISGRTFDNTRSSLNDAALPHSQSRSPAKSRFGEALNFLKR
jgi:hypothetical protein